MGAVTAIGSSLGLGSLINIGTESTEKLQTQITDLENKIKKEKEETEKAQANLKAQKEVQIEKFKEKCNEIVSSSIKK